MYINNMSVQEWDDPVAFSFEHNDEVSSGFYIMDTRASLAKIHWTLKRGEPSDEVQEVWAEHVGGSEFYRKLFNGLK